jgi:hypothetical protein
MSLWENLDIEDKVREILDVKSQEPGHHFGRPFMTPYQIAISFKERHPDDFQAIGKPLGGKGTGQQDSVAQYIALELSRRIKDGKISDIEGRFLHGKSLKTLQYKDEGKIIESSLMQAADLSLYRLME